jgi:mannosyl-3-phosphoglycerate phosphatase
MSITRQNYIIFSDLDGTLLDHHTYSYAPAGEALSRIRELSIPLILVSSKTRSELMHYQAELNLVGYPFVVENGAAFFTPIGYFDQLKGYQKDGLLWQYKLGSDIVKIRAALEAISLKHKYLIRGFHNSSPKEIAQKTGLEPERVQKAMQREFSIPVFFDKRAEKILNEEVGKYDLTILYGGRFMHILGKSNKGDCLRYIMKGYHQKYPNNKFVSIALGDSLNDFAMLNAADYAVLVKKYNGEYENRARLDRVIYSPDIGPSGWNKSVLSILKLQKME